MSKLPPEDRPPLSDNPTFDEFATKYPEVAAEMASRAIPETPETLLPQVENDPDLDDPDLDDPEPEGPQL